MLIAGPLVELFSFQSNWAIKPAENLKERFTPYFPTITCPRRQPHNTSYTLPCATRSASPRSARSAAGPGHSKRFANTSATTSSAPIAVSAAAAKRKARFLDAWSGVSVRIANSKGSSACCEELRFPRKVGMCFYEFPFCIFIIPHTAGLEISVLHYYHDISFYMYILFTLRSSAWSSMACRDYKVNITI